MTCQALKAWVFLEDLGGRERKILQSPDGVFLCPVFSMRREWDFLNGPGIQTRVRTVKTAVFAPMPRARVSTNHGGEAGKICAGVRAAVAQRPSKKSALRPLGGTPSAQDREPEVLRRLEARKPGRSNRVRESITKGGSCVAPCTANHASGHAEDRLTHRGFPPPFRVCDSIQLTVSDFSFHSRYPLP